MAAVLSGGAGALLTHRAGAALWGVRSHSGVIDVTTEHARSPRRYIAFHRSDIPADERTTRDGIPVTSISRTLLDLAAVVPRHQLLKAINATELQGLTDSLSLPDLLRRYPRRRGAPDLRAVLDLLPGSGVVLRSEMEALFVVFLDERRLPRPEINEEIEGLEVDCVWWQERIALELDSRGFHDNAIAYERDRERDRILSAADWHPIRVTWRQLTQTPAAVERDLRRMLAKR